MIVMEGGHQLSLEQMSNLLAAGEDVQWRAESRDDARQLVGQVLRAQQYTRLKKRDKGTVRRYLARVTGYSRAQVARLIGEFVEQGELAQRPSRRRRFPQRYSDADIALLAEVDAAHQTLSGPAVRRLLKRGWEVYGDSAYERLARISASHIYNLRRTQQYRRNQAVYRPTQSTAVSIGERRCPDPKGAPGWLRVDTVHQGDPRDGHKGVYHINAVDTVTQWQIVGCVETISELHLLPVLEAMLHQFPFRIRGFHADNGSEFINRNVAGLLEKLRVREFTKSRANRSTDNALVEGKNGAVIRKTVGYGHIAAPHAAAFNRFYMTHLNPYLNFHRPCGFAVVITGDRGQRKRRYPADDYLTPLEKLKTLDKWEGWLKPGINAARLERQASALTDTESAKRMQKARNELLVRCRAV